jgi:phage tail sheath protein FI
MPELINLISPQISVTEEDQTQYNIEAPGPIGAIILRNAWKGKENDTIMVANENELVATFGQPHDNADNYYDMFSAIGFLTEANQLYCTRVLPATAKFAGTTATTGVSATFTATTSATAYGLGDGAGEISDPDLFDDEVGITGVDLMSIISAYRGYSGNYIRVAVCDKTYYDLIRKKTITGWDTYSTIFSVDSNLETTKEFLVLVQECKQNTDPTVEANWSFVEAWNVSCEPNKLDDLGQSMYVTDKINANSAYIRVAFNAVYNNTAINCATSSWQRLAGGVNVVGGETDPLYWASPTSDDIDAAYDLYANSEDNKVDVFLDGGKNTAQKLKMIQIANTRRDCTAIIDPPSTAVVSNKGSEEADLVSWIDTLYNSFSDFNTSYAVTYGNWLDIRDKYSNRYRWIPSSGYAGAVYARCRQKYQKWSAPWGLNRGAVVGVRRLAWNPSLAQRDAIYKFGINSIVSFSGQGKFVWSGKTLLNKDSAFNQINVRLLFLAIESEINDIAKYYLGEGNTTIKRTQFINDIAPVLENAKGNEGINDYKIVCDTTNNTTDSINRGELIADIWIQPVSAIRYIRLNYIATKTGVSVTEV